ncbi:MAG: hypothetical protein M3O34_19780 [Chloroflexota bacterium]|nr:hypothetical protein [Chloroflexota bacterium]
MTAGATLGVQAPTVGGAFASIDRWLDTMRGSSGYGGPVAHWWRDSLAFCGAGLDWRYEGIIAGYLAAYERDGSTVWLDKARRAGEDLVSGQRPDGHFRDSRFELNPGPAGTPHEAAADVGLLLLARALRRRGDDGWARYLAAADLNLRRFALDCLWDADAGRFRDGIGIPSFVPNKSATIIEALCLLAELTGASELLERYVRPTADAILALQVRAAGSPLNGAIAQNVLGRTTVEKYLPYYQARCATGLLAAYDYLGDARYLDGAIRAMTFVRRRRDADGAFPMVVYADGRENRFPRLVAATGDILRAADLLRPHGLDFPAEPTLGWLLRGRLPSGGIATAHGFAAQVRQHGQPARELRDVLPVCGWDDKAFRYLAGRPDLGEGDEPGADLDHACTFRGRVVTLSEDATSIVVRQRGAPIYRWTKGTPWAEVRAGWAVTA